MTESEIVSKAIDLVEAINNNDLTNTIEIIDYFNNNFTPTKSIPNLNNQIPLYELIIKHINNECYYYLLDNLQWFDNIDQLKWDIKVQQLKIYGTTEEIVNFILNTLNNSISPRQANSLINLAVKVDKYDFLPIIKTKIMEV